ncbi:SAM-dependent methyltransferase [Nonomuraea sp. CA-141351]|uniref:SAM-dependent methyltransferase n=1 Tax=Nonomuraea sp. CA-141351 TaxID=3239996 RepID=UPI003D89EE45
MTDLTDVCVEGGFVGGRVDGGPVLPAGQARVYNALHGGKDNYGQDRELADELLKIFPGLPQVADANIRFLRRAVRDLARAGIWQFVDLGSGYPIEPYLHEVAAEAAEGIRMAYVDQNATVCSHLRALCRAEGVVTVEHDLRNVDAVLGDPLLQKVIDSRVPTAFIMGAVWHFLGDEEVRQLIGDLRERSAPGSLMVFSLARRDDLPQEKIAKAIQVYAERVSPVVLRTMPEILQLLGGCALLPPGLVKTYAWSPDDPDDVTLAIDDADTPHLYAAVAGFLPDRRSLAGYAKEGW